MSFEFEAATFLPILVGLALTALLFLVKLASWQDRSKISSLTAGAEFPIDATSSFLGLIIGAPALVPAVKDIAIGIGIYTFIAVIVQVLCFRIVTDNHLQYAQLGPAAKMVFAYFISYALFFGALLATLNLLAGAINA